MTTLLDHKTTLEYLAYLGYPGDSTTGALQVTKPRKFDRKKGKSSRNVFLTFVCGAPGSGKTSLLRNFAGKPYLDAYHPTKKPISVVNSVDIDGSEKYLVVRFHNKSGSMFLTLLKLQEFGSSTEAETLRNSKKADLADVIIYVHDSSDTNSFSYISNLRVSVLHRPDGGRSNRRQAATIQFRPYPHPVCCDKIGFGSSATGKR